MRRPEPFLGIFGRSRPLVFVRLNGKAIDDEAFARLMEKYGEDVSGLELRNTRITDQGLRALKGFTNLQVLNLGNVDTRASRPVSGCRSPPSPTPA